MQLYMEGKLYIHETFILENAFPTEIQQTTKNQFYSLKVQAKIDLATYQLLYYNKLITLNRQTDVIYLDNIRGAFDSIPHNELEL